MSAPVVPTPLVLLIIAVLVVPVPPITNGTVALVTTVGVVIVGGEAKRSDWTGIGPITTPTFAWNYAPLSIREANETHWGFDFPLSLYNYFGGTTGATTEPIIAIDPDL